MLHLSCLLLAASLAAVEMDTAICGLQSSNPVERDRARQALIGVAVGHGADALRSTLRVLESLASEDFANPQTMAGLLQKLERGPTSAWTVRAKMMAVALGPGRPNGEQADQALDRLLTRCTTEESIDVAWCLARLRQTDGRLSEAESAAVHALGSFDALRDQSYYQGIRTRDELSGLRDAIHRQLHADETLLALFARAEDLRRASSWGQAAEAYGQISAQAPTHDLAMASRIGIDRCTARLGKADEAEKDFLAVVAEQPEGRWRAQALLGIAEVQLFERFAASGAERILSVVLKPEASARDDTWNAARGEALFLLGVCRIVASDPDGAATALRQHIALSPPRTWAGHTIPMLANRLLETCARGESPVWKARDVLMGNERIRTLIVIASCYADAGDAASALALFHRIHDGPRLGPQPIQRAFASFEAAYQLRMLGRTDEALPLLDRAVQEFPNPPVATAALMDKARALLARGDHGPALRCYDAILQRWPRSAEAPQALYFCGMTHFFLDRHSEAMAAFKRLVGDYPRSWEAGRVSANEMIELHDLMTSSEKP